MKRWDLTINVKFVNEPFIGLCQLNSRMMFDLAICCIWSALLCDHWWTCSCSIHHPNSFAYSEYRLAHKAHSMLFLVSLNIDSFWESNWPRMNWASFSDNRSFCFSSFIASDIVCCFAFLLLNCCCNVLVFLFNLFSRSGLSELGEMFRQYLWQINNHCGHESFFWIGIVAKVEWIYFVLGRFFSSFK